MSARPGDPPLTRHAARNREFWDAYSDEYQASHGAQLGAVGAAWGVWQIPESELGVLGDVRGRDVLELGCGAAQFSIALAQRDARCVGLDLSERQLEHAARLQGAAGVDFPLVPGSAESLPFADAAFDVVFCDHGAMVFADPYLTVPEAARVLRPGGLFAFSTYTPIVELCWPPGADEPGDRLAADYFGMHRLELGHAEHVEFQLPYAEWIRLFRRSGFVVEDLVELRPAEGATSSYRGAETYQWARRWPLEHIWRLRRGGWAAAVGP